MTPARPLWYLSSPLRIGGHCCICVLSSSISGIAAARLLSCDQQAACNYITTTEPTRVFHIQRISVWQVPPLVRPGGCVAIRYSEQRSRESHNVGHPGWNRILDPATSAMERSLTSTLIVPA